MKSRRILITGLSSQVGGLLAQTLEDDAELDAIVGVDTSDPRHRFERTEFVRVDTDPDTLHRILAAAGIDTVVDTRLIADPLVASPKRSHEINLAGTASVVAACDAPDSPVRGRPVPSEHSIAPGNRQPLLELQTRVPSG